MAKTSMFTRARLQLPLTPSERGFLKILKGLAVSAVMTGITAVWPLVQSQNVNWHLVVVTGVLTTAYSLFMGLDKFWSSQGDTPLATLAGDVGAIIQHAEPAPAASNI